MARRGKRKRLARGIYEDGTGVSAVVMERGQRAEKRYPRGTKLRVMQEWQDFQREKFRTTCSNFQRGSLEESVRRYLSTATAMPSYRQRAFDLRQWLPLLGPSRPRGTITAAELDAVMQQWLCDGLSSTTVRHRRTALLRMYNVLDGKHADNPVKQTTRPRDPAPEVRDVPMDVVAALFAIFPPVASRARLKLLAYAGLPPKQLKAMTRADVDYERGVARVPARSKGRGAASTLRSLTTQAIEAFKELERFEGWGGFSTSALWQFFQRGAEKLNAQRLEAGLSPLPHMRPYDLRHSFATALYEQTGDLETVARFLGQANTVMTRRYAQAAMRKVDASAAARLSATLSAAKCSITGDGTLTEVTGGSDVVH